MSLQAGPAGGGVGSADQVVQPEMGAGAPPAGHYDRRVQFMVLGQLFECPIHYQPLKPIGKGAYGVVCSARHLVTGRDVAVKRIGRAFDNVIDAKRTLREIRLLKHFQSCSSHENVIQILDLWPPADWTKFDDVYIVYEIMDTDLHQIVKSNQDLSDEHCQYFVYQILRGLKYIHSAGVLHRDLKPSNLLVNANCDLKICDFGLARGTHGNEMMTEYVVTRWYRAPELLLSCSGYTGAIDVWSVGCIIAELLGRRPIFPGRDYMHQLALVVKALGMPPKEELEFIAHERARAYIESLGVGPEPGVVWEDMFPDAPPAAVDLLKRMLVFDPSKRITVDQALEHPWMASLHDLNDEPTCSVPFQFDFEDVQLDGNSLRELIYREVLHFHPTHRFAS